MRTEVLFEEYRGELLECVHSGMITIVDRSGIVASCGDTDWMCYYRSCSKPIQSLPVIMRRLDQKYGLTEEETAMFSASHFGDPYHIALLESILLKTGLREDQLIMKPIYPDRESERLRLLRAGLPPRKLYHCCSGKHLGMLLLARELSEPEDTYWRMDSRVQHEILRTIAAMSGVTEQMIRMGIDGCGVPVYAVPFHAIAASFLRLQCPELIENDLLREAVIRNCDMIHRYPNTIAGEGVVCSILTADRDVLGKSGAAGVYAMGIQSLGLGIVAKVLDGSHDEYGSLPLHICRQLGYETNATRKLAQCYSDVIFNSNHDPVGIRKAVFTLTPKNK